MNKTQLKPVISRHNEDQWADEIILNGIRSFRLIIVERYKTSHLSGDEWRYSYYWEMLVDGEWQNYCRGSSNQDAAIASFYPKFMNDCKEWHDDICYSIQFLWKGQPLIEMSNEGEAVTMLNAIGCIAWSLVTAGEDAAERDDSNVCAQPGCAELPVSTFRKIRHRWAGENHWSEHYDGNYIRRFCKKHLRRGDCGLDDADDNYELIKGVGPDGNEPDPNVVSQSIFGGVINL